MNGLRILTLLATVALLIAISASMSSAQTARPLRGFYTNEEIVAGLTDRSVDLADSLGVFRRVVESLPDTVEMMPSENYYYFGFYTDGRLITGSMSLFPHERDSGLIGFGYTEKRGDHEPVGSHLLGGWGTFGPESGVTVSRIEAGLWRVATSSRSVTFRVAVNRPVAGDRPRVRAGERIVLRTLDESGIPFALVLDRREKKMFWVLDDSRDVPESFQQLGERLELGVRTRFAFYADSTMDRRVLVGVDGYNVLGNTWFDGPFDQIPDNDIERGAVDFAGAISVAYPNLADRIDRFGKYRDNPSTRVAIAPYLVYFSIDELVEGARICRIESSTASRRLSCLTQQVFIVPDEAYADAR
jgi:hypothetical protein